MKSGDLWHCTNPACRAELSVGPGSEVDVDRVHCGCGGFMKKRYTAPAFNYLDFLGNRSTGRFDAPAPDVLIQNVRKD